MGAPLTKVEFFVPGALRNPLNGSHAHWSKRARWAKDWRQRTHLVILTAWRTPRELLVEIGYAKKPKRVRFVARTHNHWDDDGLRAGLKPVRDGLKDAGLIHDDGPMSGHTFEYTQVIDRKQRGVFITVTPIAEQAAKEATRR